MDNQWIGYQSVRRCNDFLLTDLNKIIEITALVFTSFCELCLYNIEWDSGPSSDSEFNLHEFPVFDALWL